MNAAAVIVASGGLVAIVLLVAYLATRSASLGSELKTEKMLHGATKVERDHYKERHAVLESAFNKINARFEAYVAQNLGNASDAQVRAIINGGPDLAVANNPTVLPGVLGNGLLDPFANDSGSGAGDDVVPSPVATAGTADEPDGSV